MATKRKAAAMGSDEEPVDPSDELLFFCLGGGNEVGRSSHIIQYKGKTVMLDAGMHPAFEGLAALPFYDEFDLSTVDVLLISQYVFSLLQSQRQRMGEHLSRMVEPVWNIIAGASASASFHIDHAASLPYVLSKTNFKGRVFMTHPTKAIYKWLVQDSVRVGNISSSAEQKVQLYTEADHLSTFPIIEAIDYYTTHTISSIRITPYPAGHVLGAAMFLIEIAGLKILFTGDYSREEDRHLISAEIPKNTKIDVLITESTYGISRHTPRMEREAQLMKSITSVLNRGGRALLPVFALGRAQELLLILDEYWGKHPEYQKIPIYYASNLARKCMVVYQTYISAMNDNIKKLFRERLAQAEAAGDVGNAGPWDFRFVRSLKSLERFDDVGGCVMLASPGMMQNGVSRELLERWAPDQRNGVIITGYSVEGTMAKEIMHEPEQITAIMTRGSQTARRPGGPREGEKVLIPRRCSVQEYSFAAHVDGPENMDFIGEVNARVVILVHGEKHNMMRLKSKLLSLNSDKTVAAKIYSPANCEELRIPFKADKIAKVVGKLAQIPPPLPFRGKGDPEGRQEELDTSKLITGVLVQNDFKMSLMAPEDLREYAGLTTTTILCRQHLNLSAAGIDLIRWALEGTFGAIEEITIEDDAVNGKVQPNGNGLHKHEDADEEISRSTTALKVMDCVTIYCRPGRSVEVEWEGNMINDGIADAVLAVLFTVESSPAAVKQSSRSHSHSHSPSPPVSALPTRLKPSHNPHASSDPSTRFARLCMFLEAQFGPNVHPITHPRLPTSDPSSTPESTDPDPEKYTKAEVTELKRLHNIGVPVPGVEIRFDNHVARVWLEDLSVECKVQALRDRVRAVVERAVETVSGLWVG
ncbi:Endoribonuclease YSH1 [Mytilinidion resinicola]|uniref:Endoribonuclease YSH1 n=1 Tax=Mytilinidion resinicola TaxID=574789 RepID=A0A6A6Z4W7_9PEZI|nr:Endoribonuclease YSH1 [Mytilinidion resinicola]KAF2815703.1 Endoribonuclease YSH1 [Mytilinidion resinicola]